jgi:CelD/BcsL family acetyltransferase involved in cellulose biosynthesis
MNLEIKIIKDNDVIELLDDNVFISKWEELAHQDDKVTVLQEPPFVITWYHEYIKKYQPILILGFDCNSEMVGVMPLAFSLKGKYLTHAGDYHAEYHGWISKRDFEQEFPVQALIAVRNNFNLRLWQWRPLPPRSQVNWLTSVDLKKEKIFVSFAEEDSPVLDLNDDSKIKRLKTKSVSNQINRFKKRNNFYLERIRSKEKAIEIFDILAAQCDFRQMAAHQTAPFANDENKKKFYIERLNFPKNNHFTILWSDSKPLAFHFGACDSDTVISGLSAYDPLEERNSPAKVHRLKLIELLREEGYRYFDLTPGGDKYKETYASIHQKIFIPTIYFFRKDKILSDFKLILKRIVKRSIKSTGIKPEVFKNNINVVVSHFKKLTKFAPNNFVRNLLSNMYEKKAYIIFEFIIDAESLKHLSDKGNVSINNYSDLLLYNQTNPIFSDRSNLFSSALKHFQSEDVLYTIVINDMLAQYGWMKKGGTPHRFFDINMDFISTEDSFLLDDFFTEANIKEEYLYTDTLEKMLLESHKNGASKAFIGISENNLIERRIIERIGFRIYCKLQSTKTLWFVNKKDYYYA